MVPAARLQHQFLERPRHREVARIPRPCTASSQIMVLRELSLGSHLFSLPPQVRHLIYNHSRSNSTLSTPLFFGATRSWNASRARRRVGSAWLFPMQRRGAKRKAAVQMDELPQGALDAEALPAQIDEEPEYPPLLQNVRNTMLKFSHCVVLTRVGGFYEVWTTSR